MTPDDVKDGDFPAVAMRNLDTIYVVQAKYLVDADAEGDLIVGGVLQSRSSQVTRQVVDITDGETNVYQSPHVNDQWYEALEMYANGLRDTHSRLESKIEQKQSEIEAKNRYINKQHDIIDRLTSLSKQLRERMQIIQPDPTTQAAGPSNPQYRSGGGIQQPPVQALDQTALQRSTAKPTAFVARCEAVRDTQDHPSQPLERLRFPCLTSSFEHPEYSQQPDVTDADSDAHVQHQSPTPSSVDMMEMESGAEETEEE